MESSLTLKKDLDVATRGDVKEIVTEAIEGFAIIVGKSFERMDRRFDEMVTKAEFEPFKRETNQSLYELKTDVSDLKTRMLGVEDRLDKIETHLVCIDARFDDIEETDDESDLWKEIERQWPKP